MSPVASMFETIADMLRGSAPDDLAHALGTDRTQTRRAMEIGLPALIAGLRDKSLEPGGAQNLAAMLDEPGAQVPDDVAAYLSAGDPSRGAALLDVAFGDRGEPALSALSGASGLSTRMLAQVMSVLAPLATGTLANGASRDATGLRRYLGSAVEDLQGKGFGRVVELVSPGIDADGSDVDAVARVGGNLDTDVGLDDGLDLDVEIDDANGIGAGALAAGAGVVGAGTVVAGVFPDSLDGAPDVTDVSVDVDATRASDVVVGDVVAGDVASRDVAADDIVIAEDLPKVGTSADFDAYGGIDEAASVTVPGEPAYTATEAVAETSAVHVEETPIDGDIDFDKGRSMSAMGWLWWLLGAILAVLLLLYFMSQCGDDAADTEEDTTTSTETAEQAEPTPDPALIQRQGALNAALAPYPGVKGEVVGTVAILTGTVPDDRTNALVDTAARAVQGMTSAQNNIQVVTVEPEGYSINDIIAAQPELSTMRALLDEAGLSDALDGNGPFTVFAPTNEAIAAAQGQLEGNREILQQLLQYHIVNGELSGADVASLTTLTTLQNELINVSVDGGSVKLNDLVTVVLPDIAGRNGVLHVINGLMFPPSTIPAPPEEIGEALSLNPITFALGSSDITAEGKAELDRVVEFLIATPTNIEIGGHTDSDGSDDLNRTLSQDRADAVRTYLIEQGIPAESLTAVGFGEANPVAPNDTDANKALNRRIEFRPV